jgi:hypothetical protein
MKIRMRDDLAEEGLAVPASPTFEKYDTLGDVVYITAEELEGAVQGDDPADPDDHAYWYIKLKDGRSLYFVGADLDFEYSTITVWRNPTPSEIRFGHGATHYKDMPLELWKRKDGSLKFWTVCPHDGLRYYRSRY